MPNCVVVLKKIEEASNLASKLIKSSSEPLTIQLIKPQKPQEELNESIDIPPKINRDAFPSVDIDTVKLLSPKLTRQLRQKTMAFWLMPFGFITGLAFTKMTGLKTFQNFGFNPIAEPLIGSFLGMGSGWIGSYVASASINPDINDDIGTLRKLNKEGLWLLLVKTPLEVELPWSILKESNNLQIMRLNDL